MATTPHSASTTPKGMLSIAKPYALEALTADLLPAAEPLGLDVGSRYWASAADYEANGFGLYCGMAVTAEVHDRYFGQFLSPAS